MESNYTFNWASLAFSSKKPLRELNAIFIAAPREMSEKRFTQLVKTYLPKGNILLGIANEPFIEGFGNQPQFKTLKLEQVAKIIDKVNTSTSVNKVYVLSYFQRELPYILEKVAFKHVVLVNGSWYLSFHTTPAYYAIVNNKQSYEYVSPFASEEEARNYALPYIDPPLPKNQKATQTAHEMMRLASHAATLSFATDYQTGAVLGRLVENNSYQFLAHACNTVVPYLTYAMHNGAAREIHFSPPNDQNYYDTIHAETALILRLLKQKIDPTGTTLFINLLPCPNCARMLCGTDIAEVIYEIDHSDGYAVTLLEAAGKKVTRIVG